MRMYDILAKKRDGGILTDEQIQFFIDGYVSGAIPDYQASALLMAIFPKRDDAARDSGAHQEYGAIRRPGGSFLNRRDQGR